MSTQQCFCKTKKIKKRVIQHGNIKNISINKNCPKFIIGQCWMTNKDQILKYSRHSDANYLQEGFDIVSGWIQSGKRDSLNLGHLIKLFGKSQDNHQHRRNYHCAKAFYSFLSENSLQIMMSNKKVVNVLSYLICLQKFTGRLGHPGLVYKLQFK